MQLATSLLKESAGPPSKIKEMNHPIIKLIEKLNFDKLKKEGESQIVGNILDFMETGQNENEDVLATIFRRNSAESRVRSV